MSSIKIKKNNGFTLIELIVVIAILGILVAIAVPKMSNIFEKAKLSADKATLRTLNNVTTMYKIENSIFDEDIFAGLTENENRILRLADNGYLASEVTPQQKDASFEWSIDDQIWQLYVDNSPIQLSPLGSDFAEISTEMIALIVQHYNDTNSYGRTWGDYRYTDIGLDPADWQDPILHMKYRPSGSQLLVTPEQGYNFKVENTQGTIKTVYDTYNLIYDTVQEKWYWHSVNPENEINIDTLQIVN